MKKEEEGSMQPGQHRPGWHSVLAGATAGFVTRVVVSPFDVLKIRAQLQIEKRTNPEAKYRGMLHTASTMLKEEGLAAFWKGHVAAQVLSVSYGAVQFGIYPVALRATTELFGTDPDRITKHKNIAEKTNTSRIVLNVHEFAAGGLAAGMATSFTYPVDTLRTRFVGQLEPKIYTSLHHGATTILRTEGIAAFYKGLLPGLAQIIPGAALQFGTYGALRALAVERMPDMDDSLSALACGAVAGAVSKLAVLPLDVVKKRLQVQGFDETARSSFGRVQHYSSAANCITLIARHEGAAGFFKGALPSLLKAMPNSALNFAMYNAVLEVLADVPPPEEAWT